MDWLIVIVVSVVVGFGLPWTIVRMQWVREDRQWARQADRALAAAVGMTQEELYRDCGPPRKINFWTGPLR